MSTILADNLGIETPKPGSAVSLVILLLLRYDMLTIAFSIP